MKNQYFILIFTFCTNFFAIAQKELWGVNEGAQYGFNETYFGNITKTDINGQNPAIMHEFDSINGYRPKGKLFLASNGKLYGTTEKGGNRQQIGLDLYRTAGALFEFDLILNKYRVVKYFDFTVSGPDPYFTGINPQIGVLEPISGQLYGATSNRIYKYDINLETVTFYNNLPYNNFFGNELMKASDGNLYGTSYESYCPTVFATNYANGCVVKFNMVTNNLSVVHPLHCDLVSEGFFPQGKLNEVSLGKLIGITINGGINSIQFGGTLFEYNFNSNVFTKKIDLNQIISGNYPVSIESGNIGKIYGLCREGGAPQTCNPENNFGTLFEYTHSTNSLEIKKYFSSCGDNIQYPKSLLKTSEGHFIGISNTPGTFKWNANTNEIISTDYDPLLPINAQINTNFIEICRKPSYQEFLPNTYTPEQGTAFTYNIQNTNATTYVWKKGISLLPAQTTGILNLPSVTTNDNGIYTCTMTNECGTTVTMPLNINVTNLATETVDNYKEFITLHPNPTKASINLKFPENRGLKAIYYKVTNLLGQVVLQNDIAKNNTATCITIDTAGFTNGIYQVTLATDKGNWNGKFVKE